MATLSAWLAQAPAKRISGAVSSVSSTESSLVQSLSRAIWQVNERWQFKIGEQFRSQSVSSLAVRGSLEPGRIDTNSLILQPVPLAVKQSNSRVPQMVQPSPWSPVHTATFWMILLDEKQPRGEIWTKSAGCHQRFRHPDGRRVTVTFRSPGQTFGIGLLKG